MKTTIKKTSEIDKKWLLIDAQDKILGRLATKIAMILMGKHKPSFSPHQDCGDFVVVVNARAIKVTGKKVQEKIYRHHSGYPGGLKEYNFERLMERKPEEIIKRAVKRMLPNNNLGRKLLKNLKVYADSKHTQQAQKPVSINV